MPKRGRMEWIKFRFLVGPLGIEPSYSACKAAAAPYGSGPADIYIYIIFDN